MSKELKVELEVVKALCHKLPAPILNDIAIAIKQSPKEVVAIIKEEVSKQISYGVEGIKSEE